MKFWFSVFLMCVAWMPSLVLAQNLNSVEGDRQALVDLYNATNGNNWSNNTGWLNGNPSNSWYGVEVDNNGRVIRLDLFKNNLKGELPESIGNLTELRFFSVKRNPIFSSIPSTIANWTKVNTILLSSAGDYNIPEQNVYNEWLGKLYDDSVAKYHGTIPDVFDKMPNLRIFEIAFSPDLDGQPFPSSAYQHPSLEILMLQGVKLTGQLNDVFDLPEIRLFVAGNNFLEGPLPGTLGNSPFLQKIFLSHSDWFLRNHATKFFTGTLPDNWANLTGMARLHIGNQDLSGEIPGFVVQNWNDLREIKLAGNRLSGEIPKEFGEFNLAIFDLSNNEFSGNLHPRLVSGMPNVILFQVRYNNLSGEVPNGEVINGEFRGWRTKNKLRTLYLSGNNFSGRLPDMPDYVGDMSIILLEDNAFSGTIPDTWERLFTPTLRDENLNRTFQNLRLNGNDLQGVIPAWFTAANGITAHLGGNRWTHRDVLENDVSISDSEGYGFKPFGFAEAFSVPDGESFTFDYSHKIHSTDRVQWTKNGSPISGGEDGILTISSMSQSDEGVYRLELTNPNSGLPATVVSEPIELRVGEGSGGSEAPQSAPTLSSPQNGSTNVTLTPTLDWNSVASATSYSLQVAEDSGFSNLVVNNSGITSSQQSISGLAYEQTYYWRVRASNSAGVSEWSSVWSFTTRNESTDGEVLPPPGLVSPGNQENNVSRIPHFEWSDVGADYYILHVNSVNPAEMVINVQVDGTSFTAVSPFLANAEYHWRVRGVKDGMEGEWGEVWAFTTSDAEMAFNIELEQNYPNPFNPSTNIRFSVSESQDVSLKVYDMTGRLVATLIDGPVQGGIIQSETFDAKGLASGIYFYRIITRSEVITRKMTLMK